MPKITAYLKVAEWNQGKYLITASTKPSHAPMQREGKALPTALFALDLDIDESRFRLAEKVLAEIKVAEEDTEVATEVVKRA